MYEKHKIPYFVQKKMEEGGPSKEIFRGRILFDQSREKDKWLNEHHSEFLLLLTSNGYSISKITEGPINYANMKDFDILVLSAIRTGSMDFNAVEIRSIAQFVSDGRGLFLIGNEYIGKEKNFNYLFNQLFGISFSDQVLDKENNANPAAGWSHSPIISIFVDHKITKQLEEIVLRDGSGLNLTKSSEPLAFSAPTAEPACVPVIGATEYGKGKVIAIGGDGIFTNDPRIGINARDNEQFILNALDWMPSWTDCPQCGSGVPPAESLCPRCKTRVLR
ncbi:MAG TPA: hypothetical protein VMV49_16260 [Candidatus Deferrimicrobium sp.]|nr:hypothetical protein [Candidatus Deferrimicrobium sp.]